MRVTFAAWHTIYRTRCMASSPACLRSACISVCRSCRRPFLSDFAEHFGDCVSDVAQRLQFLGGHTQIGVPVRPLNRAVQHVSVTAALARNPPEAVRRPDFPLTARQQRQGVAQLAFLLRRHACGLQSAGIARNSCLQSSTPHLTFQDGSCIFKIMTKLTHKMRGYVRHLPRVPGHLQAAKLREFGLSDVAIYTEGENGESLSGLIRALRKCEVVAVTQLHLLAAPKGRTSDRPRIALWQAVRGIEAKGASIIEVDTGRRTSIPAQRDDMIIEAIEKITHSGRSPRKRDVPGRPPVDFSAEEIEFARREWYDLRHKTNGAALKAIQRKVPKWTLARCYDKALGFGPSGRGK